MPRRRSSKLRLATLATVALLPGFLKRPLYRRLFGYRIGRRVRLGFSLIDAGECEIADDVCVGHLNAVIGVGKLSVGEHANIGHLNVIRGGDEVSIGRRSILGGRNSSRWTHNRQRTRPVEIGELTYVGSEIRVAPGGVIPSRCIVGIGSVVTGRIEGEYQLIAGVPARAVKPLAEEDRFLVEHKTR